MDIFDNSQPLRNLDPLVKISSDQEQSDSEDEHGLSSLADYDSYAHMNISENLKNILRMDGYDANSTQDDTESDNDSIYKAPELNIEQLNSEIKNKFTNFPLMPTEEEKKPTSKKKLTKPREKKKKRDKGKSIDILEKARQQKTKNLNDVMKKFAADESESESEEIKKKSKKGRKTRKQKEDEMKVDENGERLIRTTEFLDTDSDDSINDNRVLSKKEELEMHRNSERLRRANQVKLTPVYNVKSFEDFVKKRDEKETISLSQLDASPLSTQNVVTQLSLNDYSSDDDLIIMNDPTKLLSPDRPIHLLSPARQSTIAFRNHNKSLLSRITNEGFMHRIKMEEAAKSRGQFTSATERAQKLLEKEKNALLIDAQIKMHFERNNNTLDDDDEDEEEDEDYKEDDDEKGFLNQLSGQDEEEEDEQVVNNIEINEQEEDSDENGDMGIMAMKRWKNKKIRKSIFDDSDDDEEDQTISKKVSTPIPTHSISNFFKAKETKVEQEPIEDKPLGRLKRRVIQPDVEEEEEEEEEDAMDVDEPIIKYNEYTSKSSSGPKEKNEYFEEEAEEEEDEYYGAGGEDLDNGEDLDAFEEDDLLVHENNEHIDEAALRDVFNKQDAESDQNMIQRLLTDVTGGGLRKQKAAAEAGLMLDDIDLYDEEDNDLIAVRRAAEARRRKLLKKKGGDPLENLMSDPKTSAFAKAAQAIPGEEVTVFLSDSEEEEEEETENTNTVHTKLVIQEEDDEEDEEDKDLMDVYSEEEDLVVDQFNPMASPLRVSHSNTVITSADDDNEEFHVEAMQTAFSPLNNRRTKTMFSSPVSINRFKRLFSETSSHLSDSPRVGFGMTGQKSNKEEKKDTTMSTIGGFLQSETKSKKSKLSALTKKQDAFKYT